MKNRFTTTAVIASVLASSPVCANLINNSSFDNPLGWKFFTNGMGTFSASGEGKVVLDVLGTNMQLSTAPIPLEPNMDYILKFRAYSSSGSDMSVILLQNLAPYTNYGLRSTVNLTTSWTDIVIPFKTSGFASPVTDGRLMFWFVDKAITGDVYMIDDVILDKAVITPPPPPPPPAPTVTKHELLQITGLTPGEHCFQIAAFDAAGNVSPKSEEQCITIYEDTEIFFSPKVFIDTTVGSKRYKTYTISNRGTKEMICNAPVIIGKNADEFTTSFATDKRAIAPGGETTFRVYFEPKEVGDRIATMRVDCNSYKTPIAITLTGKGI